MAVVEDQPINYVSPIESFVSSFGISELLTSAKKLNIVLNQASVDHDGQCFWRLDAEDAETKTSIVCAKMNMQGVCTISKPVVGSNQPKPICSIQLALNNMYSYEYPFANLKAVDVVTPIAEFNRKAWGIWMHTVEGVEIASYLMSTGEQFRLCCVGTVTNTEYEMVFYSNGSKVAKVMNDLIADRIYSYDPFNDGGSGQLNRVLAKIQYQETADPHTRTLCVLTLIALSCYNLVTFFNPKTAPPRRRKRRR